MLRMSDYGMLTSKRDIYINLTPEAQGTLLESEDGEEHCGMLFSGYDVALHS